MRELSTNFQGRVIGPGDEDYDEVRRVFNGQFDRRPRLIARCAHASDVQTAIRFARDNDWPLVVRGGGHSVAGYSSVEGGVVIDLSDMRRVDVDRDRMRVRIEAGATWRDVDIETQRHGLATPGGVVSHTGVAGLVLNGGIGWLRNRYGLSCDNLLAAEMVTADAQGVRADSSRDPELLWALRGGGGNFGVVTSFDMALHSVGPDVAAVFAMYPIDRTSDILRRWRSWVEEASDDATSEVVMWTMPDWPQVADAVRGRPVVIPSAVWAGDKAQGLSKLEPLRQYGGRRHEIAGVMPFVDVQTAFDAFIPNDGSVLAYWKSVFLDELADEAIEILEERSQHRSSASTMIIVQHMGTGVRRVASDATAFNTRSGRFVVNLMGMWSDSAESVRHTEWVRDCWSRLAPWSTRTPYLNYLGDETATDAEALVQRAFGRNYPRLQAVKRRFDPDNVFCFNQNIRP